MANLETVFANTKTTENGDVAFNSTLDKMVDMLFMTEYYQKHLNDVKIGQTNVEKIFAMFMRDPRNGMGFRDYGRVLMQQSGLSYEDIVTAGRYDDLFYNWQSLTNDEFNSMAAFLYAKCVENNELVKKWMPRYSSKNLMLARKLAKTYGMNKQQYGKFIKVNTVEQNLSRKTTDNINFEHVPSLAMLKYYDRFKRGADTAIRFAKYIKDVKSGDKKLNIATSTVYDIYKNRNRIDADMFFDKIEKISGSWIPVVDTSGSMMDENDSFGKACAVGHYLAKCSTYAPNTAISFSSKPQLLHLGDKPKRHCWFNETGVNSKPNSQYCKEINSLYTGDCSNTNFGAVCELLKGLGTDAPDYIVVLSDMEFDQGSSQSKNEMMSLFKANNMHTKLIWWNFNSRNMTAPETDSYGNIFMSGYSPMLLKYLEVGFDGKQFIKNLLKAYSDKVIKNR